MHDLSDLIPIEYCLRTGLSSDCSRAVRHTFLSATQKSMQKKSPFKKNHLNSTRGFFPAKPNSLVLRPPSAAKGLPTAQRSDRVSPQAPALKIPA
jgi:hypothetical protein